MAELQRSTHAQREPRVIPLESRQSLDLDLDDLLEGGALCIFPHVEEKGLLFCHFRQRKVTISAGPYVGVIPLTPTISIDVRPKLPVSNLGRVLDCARISVSSIDGVQRLYRTKDLSSSSMLEFLLENLLDALDEIESQGLLKEYVIRNYRTSNPRGRIDLTRSLNSLWSKGQNHLVSIHQFEQASNVPVNRVIKSALHFSLIKVKANSQASKKCIQKANRALFNYPSTVEEARSSDLAICRDMLLRRTLPDSRAYYYPAMEIALVILANREASFLQYGREISLEAFIVNFETLFEEYLRRILHAAAPPDIEVRDGNFRPGKKPLFDDVRDPPAQPDIVLRSKLAKNCVIAEVKYKDRPNRQDINQAITYAISYRSGRALLVYQNQPGTTAGLVHIGTVAGIRIDGYGFDLASEKLELEETAFCKCLFSLVTSGTAT